MSFSCLFAVPLYCIIFWFTPFILKEEEKPCMHNRSLYILLLLVFFWSGVRAQETEEVVLDTAVILAPPEMEESNTGQFDSISLQKLAAVRTVPQVVVDSLKAADDFWYASLERKKKQVEEARDRGRQKNWFQQRWFRNLLWLIILGSFIGVVIWYLAASNIFIFRRSPKKINGDESEEEATDDIFSLHYDKDIAAAEEAGNYRLAVRLWYLRTLKELAERGLIDYRHGRTNQDYVSQLGNRSGYRDFFRLTRNFEYTWYGQFPLSGAAYDMMRDDFVMFKNSLP